jgi:VIT1/CCC1 family predicted Fe2+/Mn2+ transporter
MSKFSEYLREIVYGGNDGIVTTFAVLAGFTGASLMGEETLTLSFAAVMLFGLANLFADGVSMGLGNLLAIKAERDVYKVEKAKERQEIVHNTDAEIVETLTILQTQGFSETDAQRLVEIYRTNEDYWVQWMMDNELQMPNSEGVNPIYTGLATFLSFISFGAIPLIPFIFMSDTSNAFLASLGGAFTALVLLGILKWKVIRTNLFRSVAEIVFIGGSAAAVAFAVGTFFHGL